MKNKGNFIYRMRSFAEFTLSLPNVLRMTKYLLICLFAYLLICLFPEKSLADFSLGVYPPILQIHATPPASIHTQVVVSNPGDIPVNLHMDVKPFRPNLDQNGTITFLKPGEEIEGNDPNIIKKIEFTNSDGTPFTDFSLSPGAEKTVFIHAAIPKDEPSGDYYLSLLFTSLPNQGKVNGISSSGIIGGIGANLLLSIGPFTPTTGNISEFSTHPIILKGPVNFKVAVQNTSAHFTAPRGTIIITNMFNQIVGDLDLVPVNVLANSTRFMPDKDNNTIEESESEIPVVVWKEKNLFGLYTARLRLALSDQGPLFNRTIYFFALPIEVILGIIFASLIVTVVIVRVKTRLKIKE